MRTKREVAVEFLQFLADIRDPGTGDVLPAELAKRLEMGEPELLARWRKRGESVSWYQFTDELLSVLDAKQEKTGDLKAAIAWYRATPLAEFHMATPDDLVSAGAATALVKAIRR